MRTFLLAASIGILAGCTSEPANNDSDAPADIEINADVDIPTEADAEADAASEINADNADAAFEALKAEIESDDAE